MVHAVRETQGMPYQELGHGNEPLPDQEIGSDKGFMGGLGIELGLQEAGQTLGGEHMGRTQDQGQRAGPGVGAEVSKLRLEQQKNMFRLVESL